MTGHRCEHPIHPAVGRVLEAGRAALHVVLRVEVRARGIGRAAGVDESQRAVLPARHDSAERGVQAEMAVEGKDCAVTAAGDRDRRARVVILTVAIRYDHVETVDGAAQKDHDQAFAARITTGGARDPGVRSEQQDARRGSGRRGAEKVAPAHPASVCFVRLVGHVDHLTLPEFCTSKCF